LIHEDGKNPSELSRKDEIFISESGLISIAGGKLTGYRKMAEKVIDKSLKLRNIKATPSQTKYLKLSGNTYENRNEFLRFIDLKCGECKQLHWNENQIVKLAYKYGKNIDLIIDIAFTQNIRNEPLRSIILAEYEYCKNYEGVQNIDDFVIRRSGINILNQKLKMKFEKY
jgi:glycerol-3-phosphate dehydrogenase